jgi:hypothetical protein
MGKLMIALHFGSNNFNMLKKVVVAQWLPDSSGKRGITLTAVINPVSGYSGLAANSYRSNRDRLH